MRLHSDRAFTIYSEGGLHAFLRTVPGIGPRRSMLHQAVAIKDHVGHAQTVCSGPLIDVKPLVTDLVAFILTGKNELVTLYPDVALASTDVPDVD